MEIFNDADAPSSSSRPGGPVRLARRNDNVSGRGGQPQQRKRVVQPPRFEQAPAEVNISLPRQQIDADDGLEVRSSSKFPAPPLVHSRSLPLS